MIRENPVARYLLHAMSALPTPFARLVFLASLRDQYTGEYVHQGWATTSSAEEVSAALGTMHRQVFEIVTVLPLLDLCREIRKHFDSIGATEAQTASFWLETEPYYEMIPAGYAPLGRELFISQIRLALEVLVRSPKWRYLEESSALPPPRPDPERPPHWLN